MRKRSLSWLPLVLAVVGGVACAPAASRSDERAAPGAQPQPRAGRAMTAVLKVEPESLAAKPLRATGTSVAHAVRLFNATLVLDDAQENPRPYLAEALPALHSDSWRVFPDGRMETTYRLRPNLTWHDGAPLSAEDFAFAWRVYATPTLGVAGSPPLSLMEQVSAPDSRTVVIAWRHLYPDAAGLTIQFQALPRYILDQPFTSFEADAFASHPFWSAEYVGLGPYRLERWEPGAVIQGVAFDGHALGRARIDRVNVRFISDENTGLTNLLAGEVHFVTDRTIRFEQATVLKREWSTSKGGTVILTPNQPRFIFFQHRPEYAVPAAILDLRVRQAIAHAVDKEALNEGLFEGEGVLSDTHITRQAPFFAEVDRVIAKYPFDPRRAEQLLNEVGLTKSRDGVFVGPGGERFSPNLLAETVGQFQREMNILVATWRAAGIDAESTGLPSSQLRDGPARAVYPTILSASASPAFKGGTGNLGNMASASIKTQANGWRGSNFGGWSNPEYDGLWAAFNATLEPRDRQAQAIEMARLISVHLPLVDLYWNFNVSAHLAALRGPDPQGVDWHVNWNVHEWDLR